jgi:hypothetical protein
MRSNKITVVLFLLFSVGSLWTAGWGAAAAQNCAGITSDISTFASTATADSEFGNFFTVFQPCLLSGVQFTSASMLLTNFTLWGGNQSVMLHFSRACQVNNVCTFPLTEAVKLYPGTTYALSYGVLNHESVYFVELYTSLTLPITSSNRAWQLTASGSSPPGTYPHPITSGKGNYFWPVQPVICV